MHSAIYLHGLSVSLGPGAHHPHHTAHEGRNYRVEEPLRRLITVAALMAHARVSCVCACESEDRACVCEP